MKSLTGYVVQTKSDDHNNKHISANRDALFRIERAIIIILGVHQSYIRLQIGVGICVVLMAEAVATGEVNNYFD